jgi:quinol monooxygenase YgiN
MVRYIMSFSVPEGREQTAQKVIDSYFNELQKQGPGGMRSQCYADYDKEGKFVHIKSFKKESVANHHFKSFVFREYLQQLASVCGQTPSFSRLQQQQTFESIY